MASCFFLFAIGEISYFKIQFFVNMYISLYYNFVVLFMSFSSFVGKFSGDS